MPQLLVDARIGDEPALPPEPQPDPTWDAGREGRDGRPRRSIENPYSLAFQAPQHRDQAQQVESAIED